MPGACISPGKMIQFHLCRVTVSDFPIWFLICSGIGVLGQIFIFQYQYHVLLLQFFDNLQSLLFSFL